MNIIVVCEYSGRVRDAFASLGHYAVSCDLLPSETAGNHFQGRIQDLLEDTGNWDVMVAHPPCTHLAVSGAAWFKYKQKEQAEALAFVQYLMDLPIPHTCIENPVSIISTRIRKPDQIIQPWQFGHPETKKTCLWLKDLPKLVSTNNVYDQMMKLPKRERERVHNMPPGPDRWKERSRTYLGIATAMANQWSGIKESK